jgi:hypothetical protein
VGSDYSTVGYDGIEIINKTPVPYYLGDGLFNRDQVYLNWETRNLRTTEAQTLTDPYGILEWAVGDGDDFYCFDHARLPDGRIVLDAVINSETGSFIMGGEYEVCWPEDAVDIAIGMTDKAIEWCYDCGSRIRHHLTGWNQDEYYWARCVARFVGDPRLGGLRARKVRPAANRSRWAYERPQLPEGWHIERLFQPDAICMRRDSDNYITDPISWECGDNVFQLATDYLRKYNWFPRSSS